MAVTPPVVPNLTGAYGNIQQALEQSAQIAGKNQGGVGMLAAAAEPLGEDAQAAFKYSIEDQLLKNQAMYGAFAEGKTLYTNDDLISDMKQHHPEIDPQHYPTLPDSVMLSPQDKNALEEHGIYNVNIEAVASEFDKKDPLKGNLFRLAARSKDDQMMNTIAGMGKMGTIPEKGTGRTIMTVNGQPIGYMDQIFGTHLNTGANASATPLIKDWNTLKYQAPDEFKTLSTEAAKFPDDPNVKGYTSSLDNIQYIEKAARENTKGSALNIQARLEQAAGGVPASRISSKVLQSEGYSKAWSDQMEQWLQTAKGGTLTPENQKNILQQSWDEEDLKRSQLLQKIKSSADMAQTQHQLDPDFAASIFSTPIQQYTAPKDNNVKRAIVRYLISKSLPADDTHISNVVNQVTGDQTKFNGLMSRYGK